MGDKFWMSFPRYSEEYNSGVCDFLNKAFTRAASGSEICCTCKKCCFRYWYRRNIIYDHLISDGFTPGYTNWCFHGDEISTRMNVDDMVKTDETNQSANIDNLLNASFRNVVEDFGSMPEVVRDDHNVQAKKYFKLVSEGNDELYPGCKRFSKLSFTIRLYHLKCLYGINNAAFTDLLDLLKEAFSEAKLPKSSNAAKKVVKDLGLNYEKIHSCPNDCIIYWEKYSKADSYHICGESRWKKNEITKNNGKKKSVPAKIFRYFPLKCRLQRLFMCPKLADSMLWHFKDRVDDGNLRHPADGQGWKDFDLRYPIFAKEPRNIRLGLATDGFNPFRTMSISHSTWPVILVIYNLPPWNCTKPEYLLLSSIIPGPSSPGKDIDIYLQPLIAELKELWEFGVETFDASTNQTFQLRTSLLWTISDFPAYAMLRGWTTKGNFACPICHYETSSQYLKHSKKMCYMNHRKFLDMNHPWRRDKKSFNGHIELGKSPDPLSGTDVLDLLNKFENDFGKGRKKRKPSSDNPWRKRSIFFELSYWEFNSCCHNLDVMHIEKNICDNIIGTLLDIQGKTKDHLNARLDLQDMGIRRELHPIHARIDELQAQGDDENMQSVAEITRDFIKPQSGRVCLYGRGVTPTDLQKNGMIQESTLKVPTECIKSIKISLEQEMQQQFAMEKALMDQKIEKLASEKAELEKKFEERLELQNASWQSKFSAMLQHLTQVSHSLRENNELIATLAAS